MGKIETIGIDEIVLTCDRIRIEEIFRRQHLQIDLGKALAKLVVIICRGPALEKTGVVGSAPAGIGLVPVQVRIVIERFRDLSGSPVGNRIFRAIFEPVIDKRGAHEGMRIEITVTRIGYGTNPEMNRPESLGRDASLYSLIQFSEKRIALGVPHEGPVETAGRQHALTGVLMLNRSAGNLKLAVVRRIFVAGLGRLPLELPEGIVDSPFKLHGIGCIDHQLVAGVVDPDGSGRYPGGAAHSVDNRADDLDEVLIGDRDLYPVRRARGALGDNAEILARQSEREREVVIARGSIIEHE